MDPFLVPSYQEATLVELDYTTILGPLPPPQLKVLITKWQNESRDWPIAERKTFSKQLQDSVDNKKFKIENQNLIKRIWHLVRYVLGLGKLAKSENILKIVQSEIQIEFHLDELLRAIVGKSKTEKNLLIRKLAKDFKNKQQTIVAQKELKGRLQVLTKSYQPLNRELRKTFIQQVAVFATLAFELEKEEERVEDFKELKLALRPLRKIKPLKESCLENIEILNPEKVAVFLSPLNELGFFYIIHQQLDSLWDNKELTPLELYLNFKENCINKWLITELQAIIDEQVDVLGESDKRLLILYKLVNKLKQEPVSITYLQATKNKLKRVTEVLALYFKKIMVKYLNFQKILADHEKELQDLFLKIKQD